MKVVENGSMIYDFISPSGNLFFFLILRSYSVSALQSFGSHALRLPYCILLPSFAVFFKLSSTTPFFLSIKFEHFHLHAAFLLISSLFILARSLFAQLIYFPSRVNQKNKKKYVGYPYFDSSKPIPKHGHAIPSFHAMLVLNQKRYLLDMEITKGKRN